MPPSGVKPSIEATTKTAPKPNVPKTKITAATNSQTSKSNRRATAVPTKGGGRTTKEMKVENGSGASSLSLRSRDTALISVPRTRNDVFHRLYTPRHIPTATAITSTITPSHPSHTTTIATTHAAPKKTITLQSLLSGGNGSLQHLHTHFEEAFSGDVCALLEELTAPLVAELNLYHAQLQQAPVSFVTGATAIATTTTTRDTNFRDISTAQTRTECRGEEGDEEENSAAYYAALCHYAAGGDTNPKKTGAAVGMTPVESAGRGLTLKLQLLCSYLLYLLQRADQRAAAEASKDNNAALRRGSTAFVLLLRSIFYFFNDKLKESLTQGDAALKDKSLFSFAATCRRGKWKAVSHTTSPGTITAQKKKAAAKPIVLDYLLTHYPLQRFAETVESASALTETELRNISSSSSSNAVASRTRASTVLSATTKVSTGALPAPRVSRPFPPRGKRRRRGSPSSSSSESTFTTESSSEEERDSESESSEDN